MAGLTKDKRTGIYAVQFHDADRSPRRKRVSTGVREARAAERIRRRWEAAYAEGLYDPWTERPQDPVDHEPPRPRRTPGPVAVTLAEARMSFLASRAHRAANTRANYERVTGWLVDHVGGERSVASVTGADVQEWIDSLDVKPVTKANYVRHLRVWFRYCTEHHRLSTDPTEAIGLERVPRRFPKALRPEDV